MEIIQTDSALTYSGVKNPFNVLFYATAEEHDTSTIDAKIKFLTAVIRSIETIETKAENEGNLTNWLSIASGISGTAIIISAATLNPIPAIATTFFGVTSALITIGGSILKNQKETPVVNNLKRYRYCLKSADIAKWAAIWELLGSTERFLDALYEGASGQLFEGKLLRKVPSINAVIDYVASVGGVTPQQLIEELGRIKNGRKPTLKLLGTGSDNSDNKVITTSNTGKNTQAELPPSKNTNFDELRKNALAIRDALVTQAAAKKLGGCIILSAPGTGKTTFLGSAWLKLKQQHGSNFKSLALVMKKKDVKHFEPIADKVIWTKNAPRRAAVEIIKFIDSTMDVGNTINRLFIDDYLASQELFDSALGGTVIDLDTYATYPNQKEANEAGSFDAIPLKAALNARLNEYWTVGREFNSCLWVSSHSPNVEDLPFCGSASARSIGNFIILARDDNREFIELALSNAKLISDGGKRKELKAKLDSLKVTTGEPLTLANTNNWVLGIVPKTILEEYESLSVSTQNTVVQKPVQETVIQDNQDTVLQEDDTAISPDSEDLNKELKAANLGISKEALAVYDKLKAFEKGAKVRDIVQSKPFGKVKTPTSKVKYYLDELVIAELVIKTKDGDTELYSCVEP